MSLKIFSVFNSTSDSSSLSCHISVPTGYSEISNIAVDKPGRRLYNVRGPMLQEAVSVLLQVDATDGNKVVTIRSPLQVREPSHLFLFDRLSCGTK